MSRLMKRLRQLRLPKVAAGRFSPVLQPFGCLQAHSCLCPLQKPASGNPDIGQRKQGEELCCVFLEPAIAHFGVTELKFDNPKRMLHLGPHAGLELFGLYTGHITSRRCLPHPLPQANCQPTWRSNSSPRPAATKPCTASTCNWTSKASAPTAAPCNSKPA